MVGCLGSGEGTLANVAWVLGGQVSLLGSVSKLVSMGFGFKINAKAFWPCSMLCYTCITSASYYIHHRMTTAELQAHNDLKAF